MVDASGGALPGAQIKAINQDTKLERTAKANAQGTYILNDLPIGKYTITFTQDGFSTEESARNSGAGRSHGFSAGTVESGRGGRFG